MAAALLISLCRPLCAESTCSEQAERRVAAAIELFDRREFLPSGLDLCDIVKKEPQCAEALWVQSFINWCMTYRYYQDSEFLKQDEMKRRALALNPNLKNAWRQSASLPQGVQTDTLEHFQIRYFSPEDRSAASDLSQILNDIYDDMGSVFELRPAAPFIVVVYSNDTVVSHWSDVSLGGFFNLSDGVLRVRIDSPASGELSLRTLARREFAKAYFSRLHLRGLPGWMREGAADFYAHADSTNSQWKDDRLAQIRTHFEKYHGPGHTGPTVTVEKMEKLYLNKRIVTTVGKTEAYLQAEAMTLLIAKAHGDSWIPSVVSKMRQGASWTSAYHEVVGVSPESVLEEFHRTWKWSGDRSS